MVLGPLSFVCLAKSSELSVAQAVSKLLPAYRDLLKEFKAMQVSWFYR